MEKNVQISILFDFYKELLTRKQADTINLYYNQDLSLSEISEHLNITRQAVRDSIKRGEKLLFELEERLGLSARFIQIQKKMRMIQRCLGEIEEMNATIFHSNLLKIKTDMIKDIVEDIIEKV